MDIKGAFDHVSANQMLKICQKLQLSKSLCYWIRSFLQNRRIQLKFDGNNQEMTNIEVGISQRSSISLILFLIGILGFVLNRKNIILMLISIEIMLLSITFLILISSLNFDDILGQTFAIYIITIAGAESAIGLGILVAFYRFNFFIITYCSYYNNNINNHETSNNYNRYNNNSYKNNQIFKINKRFKSNTIYLIYIRVNYDILGVINSFVDLKLLFGPLIYYWYIRRIRLFLITILNNPK